MLVVCCGNVRSGSTLQYQIVICLAVLRGSQEVHGYGLWSRFDELKRLAAVSGSFVVVKEHDFNDQALTMTSQTARFIYSYRDVRDVIVSYFQKNGQPADQLPSGVWGKEVRRILNNFLETDQKWSRISGILASKYEDFYRNIPLEIRRVADHLNLVVDDEEISTVAERLSADSQEKYLEKLRSSSSRKRFKDRLTGLHHNHLNGGEEKKWMGRLTREQIAYIESIAGDWLVAHGYEISNAALSA